MFDLTKLLTQHPDVANSYEDDDILSHSYDAWPVSIKWKQQGKQPCKPEVIFWPKNTQEVSSIIEWAGSEGIPITPWGLGSAVTGACLADKGGIMIDLSHMTEVTLVDEENLIITVQAGKRGDILEEKLNARGLTLNHHPQSLDRSTVGGWIATRATGQLSSRYGGIEDMLVSLEVVLPSGEVIQTKNTPRAAIGVDVKSLFLGSEGTLGIVTAITLKISRLPETRIEEAVTFTNVQDGIDVMRKLMHAQLRPSLVRFYDEDEARHAMQDKTFSSCAMFLQFEGRSNVAQAEYEVAMEICADHNGTKIGPDAVRAWLGRRYDFSAVEAILAEDGGVAETIEIADFWTSIGGTYAEIKEALKPFADEVLGHFSHVYGHGTSLYLILIGKAENAEVAEARLLEIWKTAMEICLKRGAAISHHHGVGLARLPYIKEEMASTANILNTLKAAIDPKGIMCPGKLGLDVPGEDA